MCAKLSRFFSHNVDFTRDVGTTAVNCNNKVLNVHSESAISTVISIRITYIRDGKLTCIGSDGTGITEKG